MERGEYCQIYGGGYSMELTIPKVLFGKVMHSRLFPKKNHFIYSIYYLFLPLSRLNSLPISHNKWRFLSFYDRDHGACDGSDLEQWARDLLKEHDIHADGEITLVCMPRVFGYVFNPVSFWLCHDKENNVRAILCEVHNTFGEKHTYICVHSDQRPIQGGDVLIGEKIFHVSPFLKRDGRYNFRFNITQDQFGVWIDFFDGEDNKQLATSLSGDLEKMDGHILRKAFWKYPLVTFKAIMLIHWQAVKLLAKGIKYIIKPKQKERKVSTAVKF